MPRHDQRQRPRLSAQDVEPRLLLVHFLRERRPHRHEDRLRHQPVRRLHRAARRRRREVLHGARGAGRRRAASRPSKGCADGGQLHALQEAFWAKHGLQCGFCTPGMVFAAHELLRRESESDGRADPARPRRQHVPLHRLPEHRPRRAGGGRGSAVAQDRRRPMTPPRRRRHASSAPASGGAKIRGC